MLRRYQTLGVRLAVAGFLLGAAGCDSFAKDGAVAKLTYTEDARLAYQEALGAFSEKDWESAKALFEEVRKRFPYSRYARLAALRLGDVAFERGELTQAIGHYRDFTSRGAKDADVEYARFRICKALFDDVDETIVLPPLEERDQVTIREAHGELKKFETEYPRSRYGEEVRYMREMSVQRLIRHDLYVAHFYLNDDRFEAALGRITHALQTFPSTTMTPEALALKGETLLKMKRVADARAVFEELTQKYDGPFARVGAKYLAQIAQ